MTAKLPDSVTLCIGIGAQKAGTTWLGTYFAEHPSVFMSPIKELHYFDALWLPDRMGKRNVQHLSRLKKLAKATTLKDVKEGSKRWRELELALDRVKMAGGDHDAYLAYFARRIGDRTVAAEISPEYGLLDPRHFAEMRGLHPRVKIVFLMRNPVDRVWSALRHLERKGFEVEHGFDKAIRWSGMQERSDYGRTLRALDQSFPPEDVFVEFYEGLFKEESIRRLCEFLAIPYHPAPFQTVVNKAAEKTMTEEQRHRIGTLLLPVYEYCQERYGDRLPERWRAEMKAIQGT